VLHLLALLSANAMPSAAPASTPSPAPAAIGTAEPLDSALPFNSEGLILPVVPDVGSHLATPIGTSPPSGEIVGVAQTPFVGIALQTAVAMALAKNSDLIVAQENRRIAQYRVVAASGPYDVRLALEPTYSYNQASVTNGFFAGPGASPVQTSALAANGSLSGQTLSGTHYALSANAGRTNDDTTINSFDPTYTAGFALNVTQPLLRGAGFDDARHQLELASANAQLSTDQLLVGASNTLVSVLDTYDDLIAAWRNVAIEEDALRQAKAQSESNARLVKRGAAAPVDVAESDAQVYIFQDNVLSALQTVARLQNQLKSLTLLDPADPLWTANLVPTSPPSDVGTEPVLGDLIASALTKRPEIDEVRASRRSADVDLAYARGLVKPQLDLKLGVTENGFAGASTSPALNPLNALLPPGVVLPSPPAYETGRLGQAWTNAFDGRFPQYTLGATIAFPLQNRLGRGTLGAAVEQERSIDAQQVAVIQRVEIEARNALQSYRSARARLVAATAEREAAQRVLEGEERKFGAGQSTTFLVLQRDVTLANARGSELQAATDVQEALVELDRASGQIFSHYRVDVSRVGSGSAGEPTNR
jgi:outer membrane protein TolC